MPLYGHWASCLFQMTLLNTLKEHQMVGHLRFFKKFLISMKMYEMSKISPQNNLNDTTQFREDLMEIYVSLCLRVQNRRRKWNFPLNFHTMCKLSEHYSGIFQTQSSGCASGVDHFRNFTKLKILNI